MHLHWKVYKEMHLNIKKEMHWNVYNETHWNILIAIIEIYTKYHYNYHFKEMHWQM